MTKLIIKKQICMSFALLAILMVVFSGFSSVAFAASTPNVPVLIGFKGLEDVESVKGLGGIVNRVFDYVSAISASLPPWAIEALKKIPSIAYVENDFQVNALAQSIEWNIHKINADEVWPSTSYGNTGAGINVAIIDTGIDNTHPDLTVRGGVSYVFGTTSYRDDNGHGTHCAGIVAALNNDVGVVGVAPGANLWAVKVLNSAGSGYISSIVSGIEWSITNKMQVISMSLGSSSDSVTLHAACDKAFNAGIVVVAAAGNSGPGANTVNYPAKYDSVIAVGATDSADTVASFSSRGPEVAVSAPGVSVLSTYRGATYATMSGTSMACPHVAGSAALVLKQAPWLTPAEVKSVLTSTSHAVAIPDPTAYGSGIVDAFAAVGAPQKKAPSAPQNLQAMPGNERVSLSWSLPASNGGDPIINYRVYRSDGVSSIITDVGNVLAFTDSATNGVTYSYQVTALNSIGESPKSNTATATPSATKTMTLTVSTNAQYSRGNTVTVTVTAKEGTTSLAGVSVATTIKSPSGSTVYSGSGITSSSGVATFRYQLSRSATRGTYTVTSTASASGFYSVTKTTTFRVV
jgi:hypothetical protein